MYVVRGCSHFLIVLSDIYIISFPLFPPPAIKSPRLLTACNGVRVLVEAMLDPDLSGTLWFR
jgi:hypothetical protein